MEKTARELSTWDDEGDDFEPECAIPVEDDFERGVALQGLWLCVRSQELRRGFVTAALAGVTLDLREAKLSAEGATIHFQAAASGIEVLVPPDWEVICDVDAILGGVSDRRERPRLSGRRPRLRLAGMVVAGGLSVR
jgi:Cell wall-active antibiotics response 4TMS YvqF